MSMHAEQHNPAALTVDTRKLSWLRLTLLPTLLLLSSFLTQPLQANELLLQERLDKCVTELIAATKTQPISLGDFFFLPSHSVSHFSENVRRAMTIAANQRGVRVIDQAAVEAAILAGKVSNYQNGRIIPHAAAYHVLGHYTISGPEVILTVQAIQTKDHQPVLTKQLRLFRSEMTGLTEPAQAPQHASAQAEQTEQATTSTQLLHNVQPDPYSLNQLIVNDLLANIPKNFKSTLSTKTGRNVFYSGEALQFVIGSHQDCYALTMFFSYNGDIAIFDAPNAAITPANDMQGTLLAGQPRVVPAATVGRVVAQPPFGTEIIVVITCTNHAALRQLAERITPTSTVDHPEQSGLPIGSRDNAIAAFQKLSPNLLPPSSTSETSKTSPPQWSWAKIAITTEARPQ